MTTRQACILLPVSAWSLLVLAGCSGSRDPESARNGTQEEPVPVIAAEIQPWESGTSRALPGVVRPGRRAVLSTRVSGTIQAMGVDAGARAAAGEELAQVESRDLEAGLAAAVQQVKAAETAYAQSIRDADRLQRLAAEDLIAHNRLEHARVQQREAAAAVETARAERKRQQVNYSYASITAPFDGIVSEVLLDEGSFTGPGQPVLILDDRSSVRIDVPVSMKMANRLASGAKLSVGSALLPAPIPATYVATVPALEQGGAGQIVRLSVQDPPPGIKPGQVVDVLLPGPARQGWVALPRSALLRRGQLTGTMVLEQQQEGSRVRLRWIRTVGGEIDRDNQIPVSQGLSVGEWVVLHPSPDLRDGQAVQPERESP